MGGAVHHGHPTVGAESAVLPGCPDRSRPSGIVPGRVYKSGGAPPRPRPTKGQPARCQVALQRRALVEGQEHIAREGCVGVLPGPLDCHEDVGGGRVRFHPGGQREGTDIFGWIHHAGGKQRGGGEVRGGGRCLLRMRRADLGHVGGQRAAVQVGKTVLGRRTRGAVRQQQAMPPPLLRVAGIQAQPAVAVRYAYSTDGSTGGL
mmetsp:Transcript_28605/g.82813  ORF Transcript_28605/g.82813 Transcript_28605/m.82813 type:complete len:204 (-) Transcript_28605:1-612(-)